MSTVTSVDRGMAHLLHLVLADDWDGPRASAQLRVLVPDRWILRHMAARVERALAERTSAVARRAAVTMRAALVDPAPPPLAAAHLDRASPASAAPA